MDFSRVSPSSMFGVKSCEKPSISDGELLLHWEKLAPRRYCVKDWSESRLEAPAKDGRLINRRDLQVGRLGRKW